MVDPVDPDDTGSVKDYGFACRGHRPSGVLLDATDRPAAIEK